VTLPFVMNMKSHSWSHFPAHGQAWLSLGQIGDEIDAPIGEDTVERTGDCAPVGGQSSGAWIVCQR
jgi:hypothetical protein